MPDQKEENKGFDAAARLYSDTLNILKGTQNHMNVGRSFSRQARDLHSAIARILKTTTDSLGESNKDEAEKDVVDAFLPVNYKAPTEVVDLTVAARVMFDSLKDMLVQTHSYLLTGKTVHGEVLNTLCLVAEAMRKCYETMGVSPDPSIPEEKAIGEAMSEFLPKKVKNG
jgi:hypothetical protein